MVCFAHLVRVNVMVVVNFADDLFLRLYSHCYQDSTACILLTALANAFESHLHQGQSGKDR